jgi:hypothetical protein
MVDMTADNKDAQEGTACGDDRALVESRRCAVHGCVNRSNEGEFRGDLCVPCAKAVTTGIAGYGTAWFCSQDAAIERLTSDLSRAREALGWIVGHIDRYEESSSLSEIRNRVKAAIKGEA